jgi:alpha-methylacyl-CoA racemase
MGPLHGIKIVELAGVGPAPFCAMLLADMGAEVLRIERRRAPATGAAIDILGAGMLSRGRQSIALDLKQPEAVELALRLIERGDALVEGFRPGVMERLGLGPDACLARNPALVYGRMTGWGQHGPLAHAAGHDIDYIALSGALHAIGPAEAPSIPLNLVGDFGGGGMLLAFGIVCALLEARASGVGQVVDAAMTDGSALLMTMIYQLKALGAWSNTRASNAIDGGAHFYGTYQCADGKWIAVGAIEPQFYALLLEKCGIDDPRFAAQWDRARWPELKAALAELFRARPRDEWCALLEGTDTCVAPVLDLDEAPLHPHNQARGTFVEHAGAIEPAPAPRFSRTPTNLPSSLARPASPEAILAAWGLGDEDIARLSEQ